MSSKESPTREKSTASSSQGTSPPASQLTPPEPTEDKYSTRTPSAAYSQGRTSASVQIPADGATMDKYSTSTRSPAFSQSWRSVRTPVDTITADKYSTRTPSPAFSKARRSVQISMDPTTVDEYSTRTPQPAFSQGPTSASVQIPADEATMDKHSTRTRSPAFSQGRRSVPISMDATTVDKSSTRTPSPAFSKARRSVQISMDPTTVDENSTRTPPPAFSQGPTSASVQIPADEATMDKYSTRTPSPAFSKARRSVQISVDPTTVDEYSTRTPPPAFSQGPTSASVQIPADEATMDKHSTRTRSPAFSQGRRSVLISMDPTTVDKSSTRTPSPAFSKARRSVQISMDPTTVDEYSTRTPPPAFNKYSTRTPSPALSQGRRSVQIPVGRSDLEQVVQQNVYVILGHGTVQRRVLVAAILSMVALFFHTLALRLIGRDVDHWCRPPKELLHMSPHEWRNVAIPVEADGSFSRCTVYDPPVPIGPEEERRVVNCDKWVYDIRSTDDSIVSNYNMVCGRRWLYHLSSLVYMLGAMPFAPLAGVLSDRRGRKSVIMATVSALLFASLSAATANTLVLFLLARFFVCAASSSSTLILFTLLYEVTGDEWRAAYSVWATGLAAILCPPFLAFVALLEPRWMLSQVTIVVPTVALVASCLLLDESPSWLLATSRLRDAERVLLAAAKCNGQDEGTARATFLVLKEQVERREEVSEPTRADVPRDVVSDGPVVPQEHILPAAVCWFTLNFGYYAIELRSLAPRTAWDQAAHLLLQLVFYVRAARSVVQWGYRGSLTMFLCLLCLCAPIHVVAVFHQDAMLVSLCGTLVACGCAAAMSVNYGYTAAVFPTALRASGLCVSYSFDRLGGLLAVASSAATSRQVVLAIDTAAAGMMFICLGVVRWLPEVFLQRRWQHRVPKVPRNAENRKDARQASLSQAAGNRNKKPHSQSAIVVNE